MHIYSIYRDARLREERILKTKNWIRLLKQTALLRDPVIAFEFEYFYLGPDVDRTVLGQVGPDSAAVEGDVKLHNFMFNVIAKYQEGIFHPYIGAGIGCAYVDKADLSSSLGGASYAASDSNYATAFAWQILAGVEFGIMKDLAVDLGYRYYSTKPEFDSTDIEFKTSMVTLGLKLLIF
jgi:opacity protein-like surface antigen